jgi:hypothetical protein
VAISATVAGGITVDWYDVATGGTALSTTATSFTTPSLSATTIYYAQARNTTTGCLSATRTAVTATVNEVPTVTSSTDGSRCGTGTVLLGATASTGATIDWYAATSGGTVLTGGTAALSFTTPSIAATTTYYAQARNTTSGCTSAARTAAIATINAIPTTVTVSGGGTLCATSTTLSASNGSSGTMYYQGTTSGGTSTASPTSTMLITLNGTYYFRAQSSAGCWSTEGSSVVTLQMPVTTGVEICQNGTSSALTATYNCAAVSGVSSGPNDASVGAGIGWTTPGNIGGTGTASISVAASSNSANLQGTGYGFAIPSYATIAGITVSISRQSSSSSTSTNLRDSIISLVKGGTVQSTNKATTTQFTNTLTTVTYGGVADLWGGTWTPADINASDFGVVLSARNLSTTNARTATIDFMRITVTYSLPGNLYWYTASSGGTNIGTGSSFNPVGVSNSGLANTNTAGTTTYYVECGSNPGCRGAAAFKINPSVPASVSILSLIHI